MKRNSLLLFGKCCFSLLYTTVATDSSPTPTTDPAPSLRSFLDTYARWQYRSAKELASSYWEVISPIFHSPSFQAFAFLTCLLTALFFWMLSRSKKRSRDKGYYRLQDQDAEEESSDEDDDDDHEEEEEEEEDDLPVNVNASTSTSPPLRRVKSRGSIVPQDALPGVFGSAKLFRYLEEPVVRELCRHLERVEVSAGSTLFKEGDRNPCLYIVTSGRLQHCIKGSNGQDRPLADVHPGDNVTSLLSLLEVMHGSEGEWVTSCRATVDSQVVRLSPDAMRRLLSTFPTDMVSVVRLLVVRLQRVLFFTLHRYLGLTKELVVPSSEYKAVPLPQLDESLSSREKAALYVATALHISKDQESSPRKRSSSANSNPNGNSNGNGNGNNSNGNSNGGVGSPFSSYASPLFSRGYDAILSSLAAITDLEEIEAGSILVTPNKEQKSGLYVLISGRMEIFFAGSEGGRLPLYELVPGETIGHLALLTSDASPVGAYALSDCLVAHVDRAGFESLLVQEPTLVLSVAKLVMTRLSPLVRQLDHALEWMHLSAGQTLYRQGDPSDSLFVVLSGRLMHSIKRSKGHQEIIGTSGRGDCLGELGVLTGEPRECKIRAIRDCELCLISRDVLMLIAHQNPSVMFSFSRAIGLRLSRELQAAHTGPHSKPPGGWMSVSDRFFSAMPGRVSTDVSFVMADNQLKKSRFNFATVALIPAGAFVPLADFAKRLTESLEHIGPTIHLSSSIVQGLGLAGRKEHTGKVAELKMAQWLGELEEQYRVIVYEADLTSTEWTRRCIRQADCILIVGCAEADPSLGPVEEMLASLGRKHTRRELVILHRESLPQMFPTRQWLRLRERIARHHHIRLEFIGDWDRLARFVTGEAIGLVLGGGGARGISHLGVIRALEEAGVAIDLVGGTSIGSFVAGLYAMTPLMSVVMNRSRRFSRIMSSTLQYLRDFTLPLVSYFTGRGFNKNLRRLFGMMRIEDLWLNYFCITTNISTSTQMIHREGSLWRYVRASMTLAGFLPPLCDDGHLLVDGGYVNNLPSDVMSALGAGHVLVVDVGSRFDVQSTDYGATLSGTWLLLNRLNPFSSSVKIPSMSDIQARLAYISAERKHEVIEHMVDLYIRPPINNYGTLEFGRFDEIYKAGYEHTKALIEQWRSTPAGRSVFRVIPSRPRPPASSDAPSASAPAPSGLSRLISSRTERVSSNAGPIDRIAASMCVRRGQRDDGSNRVVQLHQRRMLLNFVLPELPSLPIPQLPDKISQGLHKLSELAHRTVDGTSAKED